MGEFFDAKYALLAKWMVNSLRFMVVDAGRFGQCILMT